MDKDVSTDQTQAQNAIHREERERRRQSLLNRMMGARAKRTEPADEPTGNPHNTTALASEEISGQSVEPIEAAEVGKKQPDISQLLQKRPVPHAPLAQEIKTAASKVLRGVVAHDAGSDDVSNDVTPPASKDCNAESALDAAILQESGSSLPSEAERQGLAEKNPEKHGPHLDKAAVEALQSQIYRLKATISTVEKRFLNAKKVNKDQYEQIRTQLDQLVAQAVSAQHAGEKAQAAAQAACAQSEALDAEQVAQFAKLKTDQAQTLAQLQTQVASWSEDIESSLASLQAAEQRSAEQVEDLVKAGEAQAQQKTALESLAEQMHGLKTQLTDVVATSRDAQERAEQMQQQLQAKMREQEKTYDQMYERLQTGLQSGEELKQQLLAALQQARAQKTSVLADYESLKSGFSTHQAALDEEKQALNELRQEAQKMVMVANAARKVAVKYNNNSAERLEGIEKIAASVEQMHQASASEHAALAEHRAFISAQTQEQKALVDKLQSEARELTRLSEDIQTTEKDILALKSDVNAQVDQVVAVNEQVVQQAEAVEQHVSRIYDAVNQYIDLEQTVEHALQRLNEALAEQKEGLEKVAQIEQQFDVAVESVATIQNQWEARDQEWQQRCSANDENYRNLVALLERSRQNEAALESLLESVKTLEARSDALVQTAQGQCDHQAKMQADLAETQSRWEALITDVESSADSAKEAAAQANQTWVRIQAADVDAQERQCALAETEASVSDKVDRAQAWIKQALVKAKDWQTHADAVLAKQTALEAQCEQLLAQSVSHDADINDLSEHTQALANTAQARLVQTQALAERVSKALDQLSDQSVAADAQQSALNDLAEKTQQQVTEMLDENAALANQTRALQHRVSDQSDSLAQAQTELDSARSTLTAQQNQVDETLHQVQDLCEQWVSHQSQMARIEAQTAQALQGAQQLQTSAHEMMAAAAADQTRIQTALQTFDHLSEQVGEAITSEQRIRAEAAHLCEQVQMQLDTQEQVASDQAATTLRTEVMHDQITALEQSTQARLAQLEDLHKQAAALLTENMALQSGLKEAQQQVGDLAERAAQQMVDADTLHQRTETHLAGAQERLTKIDTLVPQLAEDMARFSALGEDYTQWESRLKSQSMTLKESEQKLKDLTKKLEQGLADASGVRDEMTAFQKEFGGLKKVLAQVLQKFKGLEQSTSLLENQDAALESAQTQDRDRIAALEAECAALAAKHAQPVASPEAEEALHKIEMQEKKIEVQEKFNEKVLGQFEHLTQGYKTLQSKIPEQVETACEATLSQLLQEQVQPHIDAELRRFMAPLQSDLGALTERVAAIENHLAQLVGGISAASSAEEQLVQLQTSASTQQAQITQLTDAVQTIQADLAAFADNAAISKAVLADNLAVPKEHKVAHPADSQDANGIGAEAVTAATDHERHAATVQTPESSEGVETHQARKETNETDAQMAPQESELDIISQQLEKLSLESQAWDEQFGDQSRGKTGKKGAKNFLFSMLVGMTVLAGTHWLKQEADANQLPTFAHSGFEVQLLHPAQKMVGPTRDLVAEKPMIAHQVQYTYRYEDQSLVLQWPLPDQVAGEEVTYGLANSALFIKGALHAPVVAIASGEVVFSGENDGQVGRMLIVQHQDALMSVYGHLSETFVDDGEQVSRGQVIARLGKSQWLEPRLYFEIRYDGQSEDPYLYFAS